MTDPANEQPESDLLPPETPAGPAGEPTAEFPSESLSVPPPVPPKKPGFLRRLFMSRKKQQAIAMQNGYLEMVDLIRAIRSHLDRQEAVQTNVLSMLKKVPEAMDHQHEVMSMFKQNLESGMENNRRLTDSMGNLNNTLASMDESQRASAHTVTDLIHRSRESEQLLREVMRRAERRMTILLTVFVLIVVGIALYFGRGQIRAAVDARSSGATEKVQAAATAEERSAEKDRDSLSEDTAADAEARVAAVQAAEEKKAAELKQKQEQEAAREKTRLAKEKEKAAKLKAKQEAKEKAKAAELKQKQEEKAAREKARIVEKEKKASEFEAEKEAKKKAQAAEKKAREAKEKAEQEAPAATAPEAESVPAPEFTLERIQPAGGKPVADEPVSLP